MNGEFYQLKAFIPGSRNLVAGVDEVVVVDSRNISSKNMTI